MIKRYGTFIILFAVLSTPLAAQTRDTVAGPVFTSADIWRAAGFVVGTVVMAPLDKHLAHTLQSKALQENKVFKTSASFFKFMGQPAPQIIGVALYGVGRVTKSQDAQRMAVHGLEAMVISSAITYPMKLLAGRARPFVFKDSASFDFKLGRGLVSEPGHVRRDFQSFPSGHATTAFAVASAVAAETSHMINRDGGPEALKLAIGAAMYGGASLVGISRVYHDQHWASDVFAGAAIGTFCGLKVVRYAYRHPQNTIDRNLIKRPASPPVYLSWSIPVGN